MADRLVPAPVGLAAPHIDPGHFQRETRPVTVGERPIQFFKNNYCIGATRTWVRRMGGGEGRLSRCEYAAGSSASAVRAALYTQRKRRRGHLGAAILIDHGDRFPIVFIALFQKSRRNAVLPHHSVTDHRKQPLSKAA
jgi:hypothetical protein